MGDFEDMESLSSYDRGKLDFEGRRYKEDVDCALDARNRIYNPIDNYLIKQILNKKRVPNITFHSLGGNHAEGRINRIVQDNPWLDGVLSVADLHPARIDHHYYPYSSPVNLDGLNYVHYWKARGNSHPIGGGKYPAATILREKMCSTVTGHSHVLDRAEIVDGEGNRKFSLVAGCFLDDQQFEGYAGQSNLLWWRGICILKDVYKGSPLGGEEYVPIKQLKERTKIIMNLM
jgi:hypothetical protein